MTMVNSGLKGFRQSQLYSVYQHIKYHLLNMVNIKCATNQQNFVKSENFHQLEVVICVSKTQLQVGENSNSEI